MDPPDSRHAMQMYRYYDRHTIHLGHLEALSGTPPPIYCSLVYRIASTSAIQESLYAVYRSSGCMCAQRTAGTVCVSSNLLIIFLLLHFPLPATRLP